MTKAKTKKPAARRTTAKPAKRAAPAKKAAPRKKASPRRAPAAPKKVAGFCVECRKSKTGAWEKLCTSSTKRAAFILANAYHKSNPEHWVRVRG